MICQRNELKEQVVSFGGVFQQIRFRIYENFKLNDDKYRNYQNNITIMRNENCLTHNC